MEKERKVRPDCVNASNPFHVCTDSCGAHKGTPNGKNRAGGAGGGAHVKNVGKVGGGSGGEYRNVDPTCVNAANPFHQCSDYCKGKNPGAKKPIQAGKPVVAAHNGAKNKVAGEGRHVDPSCVNASNPFHQCGESCAKRMNKGVKKDINSEISEVEESNVNREMHVGPPSVNTSNPLNQSSGHYSTSGSSSGGSIGSSKGSPVSTGTIKKHALGSLLAAESVKESQEKLSLRVDGKADPNCKNASNPFHVCAEYCSRGNNDIHHVQKAKSDNGSESSNRKHAVQRRVVDPRCPNADNPFHVCAAYCFEKIREAM